MIRDLARRDAAAALSTQVLIVGAGIAGILLAVRLRELGVRVVVLESGSDASSADGHPLNQVIQLGDPYRGASEGRSRCLGGTSTRWGGAMLPFIGEDLEARPHLGLPAWPIQLDALAPYLKQVEAHFHLDDGPYDERFVEQIGARKFVPAGDADLVARFAKWPAFARRNVAALFASELAKDPDLQVWLNATALSFALEAGNGRIRSVTAGHEGGARIEVIADHFVICAGAIESSRLLLLIDAQYGGAIFKGCEALGRYFHDHLSLKLADIKTDRPTELNRMAGFRFVGSTLRSLRYELAPSAQASDRVTSAFGHISFQSERESGFEALRDFLRGLQRDRRIGWDRVGPILADMPYLVRLGYWRYARRQLCWPTPARYELHVVAEQAPRHANRIALSAERDCFGLPRAAMDWRVSESDAATFIAFGQRFAAFWQRAQLDRLGTLEWRSVAGNDWAKAVTNGCDVFHPGGSTRMGLDSRQAVVDADLRTFAIQNLRVASTSAFPSGGGANPTLMLMLFTLRLAEQLAGELRR